MTHSGRRRGPRRYACAPAGNAQRRAASAAARVSDAVLSPLHCGGSSSGSRRSLKQLRRTRLRPLLPLLLLLPFMLLLLPVMPLLLRLLQLWLRPSAAPPSAATTAASRGWRGATLTARSARRA
jgi:hypothetical protein